MSFPHKKPKLLKFFWKLFVFIIPALIIVGCVIVRFSLTTLSFLFSVLAPIFISVNLVLLFILLLNKKKIFRFYALAAIVFFFSFHSFYQFNSPSVDNNDTSLSILTYNTKNFQNKIHEKKIVDFINTNNQDVILFQEFSAINYHYFKKDYPYWVKTNIMAPDKSVLATFSKYPIIEQGVIHFPNSRNNALFIDVLFEGNKLRIYNLHLESFGFRRPYSNNYLGYLKMMFKKIKTTELKHHEQVDIIINHASKFKGRVIFGGDFNSTAFSPTYLTLQKGKKDTYVEKGRGFGKTYGLNWFPIRLDFILVDSDIEVLAHENFKLGYSDHEPVYAELKIDYK